MGVELYLDFGSAEKLGSVLQSFPDQPEGTLGSRTDPFLYLEHLEKQIKVPRITKFTKVVKICLFNSLTSGFIQFSNMRRLRYS